VIFEPCNLRSIFSHDTGKARMRHKLLEQPPLRYMFCVPMLLDQMTYRLAGGRSSTQPI
jgi:hypothetical protein